MKKFMKAIAFATVMCMLLSTAVFAANEDVTVNEKTAAVTVNSVANGEQVAIIITRGDAEPYSFTNSTILFVDQKAANGTTAEFTAKIAEDVETIDVYAGYASNKGETAVLVADNVEFVGSGAEISITLAEAITVLNNVSETAGAALAYAKINVANAFEGDIAGMIWAFKFEKDGATDTKYVPADETIMDAIEAGVLSGSIEIAAALDSGEYTLADANIILSVKGSNVVLGNANADIEADKR